MTAEDKTYFNILNSIDVSDKIEKKNGLSYLSWVYAWGEVCKKYPDANYEIIKFDGIPYVYDPKTGYMVYTKVTLKGITREMWLPVMDSNNYAMKSEPYQVKTRYKTFDVKAATMFDINKTIMRCLTKNLAMFGLGLFLYAGEENNNESDTETSSTTQAPARPKAPTPAPAKEAANVREELVNYCNENNIKINDIAKEYHLNNNSTDEEFLKALDYCKFMVDMRQAKEG